jgi:hypothetical protein
MSRLCVALAGVVLLLAPPPGADQYGPHPSGGATRHLPPPAATFTPFSSTTSPHGVNPPCDKALGAVSMGPVMAKLKEIGRSIVLPQQKTDDDAASPPHLSGIFLDLTERNANFTGPQWRAEFQAMKAIKIEFIAIRSVMSGINSYTTQGCKLGHFTSFYPSTMEPSACYRRVGSNAPGGTLGIILKQAMAVGLGVHFGGLMPSSRFRGPGGKTPEEVVQWYRDLANLQVCFCHEIS